MLKNALITLAFLTPTVTHAQNMAWLNSVLDNAPKAMQGIVVVLVGFALLFFIWGVVKLIFNSGDEKSIDEGKKMMLWGIVGLFVIVSVWGFVNILINLFGTRNSSPPETPQTVNLWK